MRFDAYLQSLQKNRLQGSERTHYPALKTLLDQSGTGIDAAIEEKGNKAGIPDFTVRRRDLLVGYVEAKDLGLDLDQVEKTEQLKRYRESLPSLILTNYLEFRWYVNGDRQTQAGGQHRLKAVLSSPDHDTTKVSELIDGFLSYAGVQINNPEDLAKQLARLTRLIKYATETALQGETEDGELHQLKRGFQEVLLPDLDDPAFADMYAQTISYGLFAARVAHAQ